MLIISSAVLLQACVPAAIVGGTAVAAKVITDPRTVGTQIDDETLEERVLFNLRRDPQIRKDARLNVVSYNNMVLLVGQVPNQALKDQAGNIAKGVEYVRGVFNQLTIGPKISSGRVIKDSWVTSQAKSKLLVTKGIKSNDIKVVTENGVVYLMGDVTKQEATLVVDTVRYLDGVKKVVVLFQYLN